MLKSIHGFPNIRKKTEKSEKAKYNLQNSKDLIYEINVCLLFFWFWYQENPINKILIIFPQENIQFKKKKENIQLTW